MKRKKKGWHNEPGRHALAAQGIETTRRNNTKTNQSINIDTLKHVKDILDKKVRNGAPSNSVKVEMIDELISKLQKQLEVYEDHEYYIDALKEVQECLSPGLTAEQERTSPPWMQQKLDEYNLRRVDSKFWEYRANELLDELITAIEQEVE